jgi:hypothetical protein
MNLGASAPGHASQSLPRIYEPALALYQGMASATPLPPTHGGSVGLQPHEIPPTRPSKNQLRGETAPKPSRSLRVALSNQQSRVILSELRRMKCAKAEGPAVAFASGLVSGLGFSQAAPAPTTEGAWGFSPTKPRPPVLKRIKSAAKPRPAPCPPYTARCPILSRFCERVGQHKPRLNSVITSELRRMKCAKESRRTRGCFCLWLCIRARLQSCRKSTKTHPGFSPC